ncbi:Cytochrome P450 monooxygenase gliF [Colletotrichum gloeosporioides]|uniref:Cytochrome P450 monooxygenase gliF n=1 Tax=Colletotrichum gloeosporioides TaxID=474922 RepID=A0A8H4FGB9_COLGL|nr:Cytochrome P450 monooxygenase gliF [Colletotrichum gloeosporioides]KAF3801005.1 Cytochrome P450 monooxygenase gliF [Colletotrichum gloeosporioides]
MIDATSFLIFSVSLRREAFALSGLVLAAALLASLLAGWETRPRKRLSLPVAGRNTDKDFREALAEGRNLYPDKAFVLPSEPPIVVLPHKLINALKSAPESQLSADKEVCRRGLGQYTDLGTPMPEMFHAIKVDLTRHVRDLVPILQREVETAFEQHLELQEDGQWTEVTAFSFVKRIVTILNAVAFVGCDLARNPEWQDIAFNYSADLRKAFDALNRWHPWLRPFVHPLIFYHIGFSTRRSRVAELLRATIHESDTKGTGTHALTNFIRKRLDDRRRNDTKLLARMQLRAALAGADTVAQALTNAIFDVASEPSYSETLRNEVSSLVSDAPGGTWDMGVLRSMSKLDSLLRESARVYAPFLVAMGRITTSSLELGDGSVVPKDTTVYFDMYHAHRSCDVQNDAGISTFDAFRFSQRREEQGLPNKYLAATTGPDNLPFGHGAHSCPGRFFAVAEMKVILAHLLLNYDVRLSGGKRPEAGYWGIAVVMDRNAKILFGAKVTELDINNVSGMILRVTKSGSFGNIDMTAADDDLLELKRAVLDHKLIIIKGQENLQPIKQWELVTRLDPNARPQNPELFMKDFHPDGGGILKARGVTGVPSAENVHVIGKGFLGEDHYGLKNLNITKSFSYENHYPTLPKEELEKGHTRFQGWHFDAPLYSRDPPIFTAFRVIKLPKGPDVNIAWDNGSGLSMRSAPGLTPFFCCSQLYEELLTEEEREVVDNSWVEYAALPYEWNRNCKMFPTGLGIVSQGRELSDNDFDSIGVDHSKIKRYPMVWVNPETGRKSFQVQANAAKKLYLRRSAADEPKVITELSEVRRFLIDIQSRILKPEYILVPPEEEGDLLLWDNWSTMHTRVDYPAEYGPKACHQAGTNASVSPKGPTPIPHSITRQFADATRIGSVLGKPSTGQPGVLAAVH